MKTPQEFADAPLSALLDYSEEIGEDLAIVAKEVQNLEEELKAAKALQFEIKKESETIVNFTQQMLKYNGNVDKQQKLRTRFLSDMKSSEEKKSKASTDLLKSRNTIQNMMDQVSAQVANMKESLSKAPDDKAELPILS